MGVRLWYIRKKSSAGTNDSNNTNENTNKISNHLIEPVQIHRNENTLNSFCERAHSEVLNVKDCAEFIIHAYNTFKDEHFDLLEINKLANEQDLLETEDDGDSSDDDNDEKQNFRKLDGRTNNAIPIKIFQEFLTFISFLKGYVKHENRWISQQASLIDMSSLNTATEKRKRKEIMPFLFIQNLKESIAQYRFYSYKFNVFYHVLNHNVHVGCIHDQELMMLSLKKRLISLDVENTGFIDIAIFKQNIKSFLTANLREEDFALLNNAIDGDAIDGNKYAYGYIFDDMTNNNSVDVVRHDNAFAKELKLLHLYSSIYYRNCFIERILALKGIVSNEQVF